MRTQGVTLDVSRAIAEGTSVDAFRAAALDQLVQSRQNFQPKWTPGESKDIARFDLGRALRSMTAGRQLDGIEAEIAAEGEKEAREAGISNSGALMLPRAFVRAGMTATGTTSTAGDQGGMTVATAKGALLDDFFNASVLRDLGATVLEGLVGNLDMPRLIAGTDPAGKAENAEADAATATTAQLQLRPKRLPAYIDISDQLLNQSSSAIEALLRRHLQNQLLAIQERAFFHGSGSNEAAGIAGTSGIGAVVGGATGAAPTWAHIVSLEEKVDAQNGAMGSLAYVSNGQIRAKLKQTPKQGSGVEGNFILSDLAPNTINGYRAAFTNAVRRNLEKSTSGAVLSAIFFGNFADYVIGYWGGLALEVVRDAAGAKKGERSLVANVYYDGGVLRPKSFSAMVDAAGA
jgi:HK97 family phage major capsid protein